MRCQYCQGEIPANATTCPYCGRSFEESRKERGALDEKLAKRLSKIDEEFGLKTDYASMGTNELSRYFNDIYEKFQNIDLNDPDIKTNLGKIMSHLEEVDEQLQNRFPERVEKESKNNFKSSGDVILDLLEKCDPPEVNCAAFKIRSCTERMLKDYYKFPYEVTVLPNGRKIYGFKAKYPEMFENVTKNPEIAKEIFDDHMMLNKFVHEGKENDDAISNRYPTLKSQADFLKKAYELRKKYHLA